MGVAVDNTRTEWPDRPQWGHHKLDEYAGGGLLYRGASLDQVADRCPAGMAYLATPYSKVVTEGVTGAWSPWRSEAAAHAASTWVSALADIQITAVSPIVLAVGAVHCGGDQLDPLDHEFWMAWCAPILSASRAVIIPPINGWDDSLGVWQEAIAALTSNRSVYLISERGAS